MEIAVGLKGVASSVVAPEDTAREVGSGDLMVYATPCMAALMEGAACEALAGVLPDGKTSVGTELSIHHLCATPVGLEVRAEAEILSVEGHTITFQIAAYDEQGKIGEALHKRVVVTTERFLEKAYSKI